MKLNSIQSEDDYLRVMREIELLLDAKPNTPEGERLDFLVALAEAWEEKHHPIDVPTDQGGRAS